MKKKNLFKNKFAASQHLEMIIAFIMFIGFVFFILIFIQPYSVTYLTDSILAGTYYHFSNIAKSEIISVFISADENNWDCLEIKLPLSDIDQNKFNSSLAISAINKEKIPSEINNKILKLNKSSDNAYYVYISNFFENQDIGQCDGSVPYKIGHLKQQEIISMNRLHQLKEKYENDYKSLKQNLGIPEVFDFAIVSDIIEMKQEISPTSEVLAKEYIEKVFLDEGEIKYIKFTIKIWR